MREHGTHACYVHGPNPGSGKGCRCEPCRTANTRYELERSRRLEPPYVSAEPAREHVAWLSTQGVGLKQIAKASGVSHGALSKLVYGTPNLNRPPSKRIRPATADKILAVTPSAGAAGSKIPIGPYLEMVERLVAAGVPKIRIAERLGQSRCLQLGTTHITRAHAQTIKAMVAELDAGTLVTVRRSRFGEHPIAPEGTPSDDQQLRDVARRAQQTERARRLRHGDGADPVTIDDVDELYLEMAKILEARIDQPWRADAACRNRPSWMWFPGRGDNKTAEAARKICSACFVRAECLEANLDQTTGIYAGTTEHDRRAIRRERLAVTA